MTDGIISFIGGGNMATSLIGGLIADGRDPASIYVTDVEAVKLEYLADTFRVQTSSDNDEAVRLASTVVFAVKPQVMGPVVRSVAAAAVAHRPLFVSIAAGVREPDMRRWLGYDAAIVRSLIDELGEPIMSSTLIMPDDVLPLSDPEEIRSRLEHDVDVIIDGGFCGVDPTTVVSWVETQPSILRIGRGDPAPFL